MGMSIDEAIEHGKEQLEIFGGEHKEFIQTSIETMRKYQQIKEIVNSNPDYIHHTDMDTYKLNSIREVIEDGND